MEGLGKKIRELRNAFGQSQVLFARRLGSSQPMVARWEKEKTVPTAHWLSKLAELAETAGLHEQAEALRGAQAERKRVRPIVETRTAEELEFVNALLRIIRNPQDYAREHR